MADPRVDAAGVCARVHALLERLPDFQAPGDVPFTNGLYFFYEQGERSAHAAGGRIVRIGNHPRSQDGLKPRLRNHFTGRKNSSVFRKSLGGSLLRRADPASPCLAPGPGRGHWEKQDAKPCDQCGELESAVSQLLQDRFHFRCVRIHDRDTRNRMEAALIASVSLCSVCVPSTDWLGRFAYSEKVRQSGMWNSSYVFDVGAALSDRELVVFERLVAETPGAATR